MYGMRTTNNSGEGVIVMTSKTHVALGLLTALVIQKYNPHLDTYTLISGVCIGSLIPDLDTQKSDPAQIFPPIAWVVDKLTKHRGFTHTIFPFLLILGYYYFGSMVCLFMGIGGITHLFIDVATKALNITCGSGGEQTIYVILWFSICFIVGSYLWNEYHLIKYVPKDALKYIKSYESLLVLNK